MSQPHSPHPVVAITRGNPSAEETGAVVVVLSALAAGLKQAPPSGPPVARRSEWSARHRLLRSPLQRGPGAWRASALPR
jgi:acyl-CoA carboxylase epsilon subunit